MGAWSTRGLRGSTFEEMINITNELYKDKGLALVEKIPTPIIPIKLDNKTRTITLAYFEKKSSVDYMGVVQGIPICFDAKETSSKRLALQNIHKHQIDFMEKFQNQKGISFLLVRFATTSEIFYLPFSELKVFWENAQNGDRKSIPYEAFDKKLLVRSKNGCLVHYLEAINTVLNINEIINKKGEI